MERHTVSVRFDGPAIVSGRVPLDQLLSVLAHFQEAVRHMVESRAGRQPKRGPLPENIRVAGTLELVSTRPGSFIAEIALVEPETPELLNLGDEALHAVVDGMETPEELPDRVAVEVYQIRKSLTKEIDKVEFHDESSERIATLHWNLDETTDVPSARPSGKVTLHGRLLEVDWKDGTAELHTPTGIVRLSFASDMGSDLQRLARQQISVTGLEEVTISGQRRLELDGLSLGPRNDEFWHPRTPQELIAEQGVRPFVFPIGEPTIDDADSVDSFLDAIFAPTDDSKAS